MNFYFIDVKYFFISFLVGLCVSAIGSVVIGRNVFRKKRLQKSLPFYAFMFLFFALLIPVISTLFRMVDNPQFIKITELRESKLIPDGSSPQHVMTIDFKATRPLDFFKIISQATGKIIFVCAPLANSQSILDYKAYDVSYRKIIDDLQSRHGWKFLEDSEKIAVCDQYPVYMLGT